MYIISKIINQGGVIANGLCSSGNDRGFYFRSNKTSNIFAAFSGKLLSLRNESKDWSDVIRIQHVYLRVGTVLPGKLVL